MIQTAARSLEDDPLLGCQQVARMLGFTDSHVRLLCQRGQSAARNSRGKGPYLVASKHGTEWMVRRSEVFKLLNRMVALKLARSLS